MIPRNELTKQFVEHMIDGLDVNDLARIVSAYMTAPRFERLPRIC